MGNGISHFEKQTPVPQMRMYADWLADTHNRQFATYEELWKWSVTDLSGFWQSIWDYNRIESPTPYVSVLNGTGMPITRWFTGAQVNYARQVFRHMQAADAAGQPSIIAENECGKIAQLSWAELHRRTASLALDLRRRGVGKGDCVAAFLPNIPEAVIGLLACASLGAIWTLCSPEMGANAVIDRLKQASPKIFIAADGVFYAGRAVDRSDVIVQICDALPSITSLYVIESGYGRAAMADAIRFEDAISADDADVRGFEPEWLPFDHPLWILYSSGTTGLPKAIVHGHGGVIVATCAGQLHFDLGASYTRNNWGDRFHWYSATGWVMWNIQVGGLLSGTTICLFDGSPSGSKENPDWYHLWRFAARNKVTWLGAGAAYFTSCSKAGIDLSLVPGIENIRALGSTGSPLPPNVQQWGTTQFAGLGRPDIWWCNVSGGTEIAAAFMAGNPELPDTPGRLQCRHVGAAIEAWNERGEPVTGEVGELVCTQPFPSMPLYFLGDTDGSRYHDAYFSTWPGIWRHGDWLTINDDGSCTISGRSDATINRFGLRMGTAEIYAAIETLPEVADSMVIDVDDLDGESRLLMFVVPAEGCRVDELMEQAIVGAIRAYLSPRFVPDRLIEARDIPRTLSGKKQELPIKRLFGGWDVNRVINKDAIANPGIIEFYVEQARQWRDPSGSRTLRQTGERQ